MLRFLSWCRRIVDVGGRCQCQVTKTVKERERVKVMCHQMSVSKTKERKVLEKRESREDILLTSSLREVSNNVWQVDNSSLDKSHPLIDFEVNASRINVILEVETDRKVGNTRDS